MIRDSSHNNTETMSSVDPILRMPSFASLVQMVIVRTGSSVFYDTPIEAFRIKRPPSSAFPYVQNIKVYYPECHLNDYVNMKTKALVAALGSHNPAHSSSSHC